ncbi:MAG: VWA domain-containing protein [Firmicutes bacterium]|nr:VWA domain-containing protein [Bacillota bacterium]
MFGENALLDRMPATNFTSIETALSLGLLHAHNTKKAVRLVLLSDGQENVGNALAVVPMLLERNLPVDVVPLASPIEHEVWVEHFFIPERVSLNQDFVLRLNVRSTITTSGTVRIYLNDQLIFTEAVEFQAGNNPYSFHQRLSQGEFHRYTVEIEAEADTVSENNILSDFVYGEGEKRVLLISKSGEDSERLITEMDWRGFKVERSEPGVFVGFNYLQSFSAVILNNVPIHQISSKQSQEFHRYVRELGGGLICIGGDLSYGMGGYTNEYFESLLPVHSSIEQRILFPTLSLLLIIDKSGSMDERSTDDRQISKMDLAKEASKAVLDLLVSEERIGILSFDVVPEWTVPLQPAIDKDAIVQRLAELQPGGGTDIYSALVTGSEELQKEETALRHIILLSDGITDPADFEVLIKGLTKKGITVSTVTIGDAADKELMEDIAYWGGGEAYFTTDFGNIVQVFIAETNRILKKAIIEGSFHPRVTETTPLTTDVDWERILPFRGYIATTPRALADVHLVAPDNSPILASWRIGLGRTVSFLSDLGSKWTKDWLYTEDFGKFWSQVLNFVARDNLLNNVQARFSIEGTSITMVLDVLDEGEYVNFLDLEALVIDPDGQVFSVPLRQTNAGEYTASFSAETIGAYYISVLIASDDFATVYQTGIVMQYSPEYKIDSGKSVLMALANETGGRVLFSPEELFLESARIPIESEEKWDVCILVALVLFIIEIALRLLTWQSLTRPWTFFKTKLVTKSRNIDRVGEEIVAKKRYFD